MRYLEEAKRENRRIIAALTSRIPTIEAPQEPQESPETVEEESEAASPGPIPRPGEVCRGRPWWSRVFGGG